MATNPLREWFIGDLTEDQAWCRTLPDAKASLRKTLREATDRLENLRATFVDTFVEGLPALGGDTEDDLESGSLCLSRGSAVEDFLGACYNSYSGLDLGYAHPSTVRLRSVNERQ